MFCTSRKYVYQYGDATVVVEHGSKNNPIIYLFIFTRNTSHNNYYYNFKNHFVTKRFYRKSKGDSLFYIVELNYLFL